MQRSLRRRLGVAVTGLAVASAGLAMTSVIAPPASAAEESVAIGNGDFEQPVISTDGYAFTNFTSPSGFVGLNGVGWEVTSGDVELVNHHVWKGNGGTGQSLDLNGNGPGQICQAFPTGPGFDYVVEFYMSRNASAGLASADLTMTAKDADGPLGLVDANDPEDGPITGQATHSGAWSSAEPNWLPHQMQFEARRTSTTVCFASDVPSGGYGPALDDVSVTKLNETPVITIINPTDANFPDSVEKFYVDQQTDFEFECVDPDGDETELSAAWRNHADDPNLDASHHEVESGDPIPTGTVGNYQLTVECSDTQLDTEEGVVFVDPVVATADYQVLSTVAACRATSASLLRLKLADANPAFFPCATKTAAVVDSTTIIGPTSPLAALNSTVALKALRANTYRGPGDVLASASIAEARVKLGILPLDITIRAIKSRVDSAVPDNCATQTAATSTVASVKVNGKVTNVGDQAMALALPGGLGVIHLNQKVVNSDGTTTARAVFIDLPGTTLDVVLAESTAGIACTPLAPPPVIIIPPTCPDCPLP